VGDTLKTKVFVPHLPSSSEELQAWITEAAVTTAVDMINRIWVETAYR
jgi:hypothetical protein